MIKHILRTVLYASSALPVRPVLSPGFVARPASRGVPPCLSRIELIDVESVEAEDSGFSARAIWTVGGTVTHFGHRHFRQNRYDARVSLVPDDDVWKIREIEVFDEERLR